MSDVVSQLPALPSTHVARPRLVGLVRPDTRIVCVVAGSGWGKSVLLRELCVGHHHRLDRVVWVELGADANEPSAVWLGVVDAAIAAMGAVGCTEADAIERLRSHAVGLAKSLEVDGWLARSLAADLADVLGPDPWTIVVDDLHTVPDGALRPWWAFVEALPHHVSVMMASRHERSFPLAAWRLRDDVHVVTERDLAYDAAETAAMVERIGPDIVSAAVVDRIAAASEGWPAGVQFRTLALIGDAAASPTAGARRPTAERSAEGTPADDRQLLREVLDGLEPDVRRFLLDTCVLAELTIPACHALSGRSDAGAVLIDLVRRSLFTVRLEATDDRYRYHHLFRELLRDELAADDPERLAALHRSAADHLLATGAVSAAASHLVDIGDHEGALTMLLANHVTVMEAAQYLELPSLLERVPLGAVASDALRTFEMGFLLASGGHVLAGRRIVERLRGVPLEPELERRVHWVTLLTSCVIGDVTDDAIDGRPAEPPEPAVAQFWREIPISLAIVDRYSTLDEIWAEGSSWGMHAASDPLIHASSQIFLEAWRGRIRDVVADTAEAEESLASSQVRQRAAFVRIAITRALIDIELGDPQQAVEHLQHAADELAGRVIPHTTHDVPLQHAVLRALRLSGRADLALERGLAEERAIDRSRAQLRCSISEEVVRAACAIDDLAIAEARLDALRGPCARHLATAWIALARGDRRSARQAVACLDLPDLLVRAPRRALDVLEVRHRAALSRREQDDLREAAALLADEHGLSRSYRVAFGGVAGLASGRADAGVQPLSERELDVLRGLASGASSRQLAASLAVSPNTLKTHLRAVYRKLGAVDRADAVWRARAAGLVPSVERTSPH